MTTSYHRSANDEVLAFFAEVFAALGRDLDLTSKDRDLADIPADYQRAGGEFWMLRHGEDGPVIGTIALRRLDDRCAEIKRFYVARAWHGQGLGKSLLRTALEQARVQGFAKVRLDTNVGAVAAVRLFEAHGFTPIGRYNDNPYAELFYELDFGPVVRKRDAFVALHQDEHAGAPHGSMRPMKAIVRRLEAGEADLYRAVRLESLQESPDAFATTYESALARDTDSWRAQADGSATGRDRATFVVLAGRPVGLGALYRDPDGSAAGELIQMWVAPECRGGPVATELLEAIFRWAAGNGFETIRAEVTAGNARALRFYEKHGFVRVAEPVGVGGSAYRLTKRIQCAT